EESGYVDSQVPSYGGERSRSWSKGKTFGGGSSYYSSRKKESSSTFNDFASDFSGKKKKISQEGDFKVGDLVTHPKFGLGEIQTIQGSGQNESATVNFYESGTKTLVLRFAPIEKLE
ncbi:MAG: hypothetical protein LBM13_03285, partial [Candidatus Ancillula sp.]|nr:hypothetical protein [Candidatus Ancillula sp.]